MSSVSSEGDGGAGYSTRLDLREGMEGRVSGSSMRSG